MRKDKRYLPADYVFDPERIYWKNLELWAFSIIVLNEYKED